MGVKMGVKIRIEERTSFLKKRSKKLSPIY
jgi:hypothetical protein